MAYYATPSSQNMQRVIEEDSKRAEWMRELWKRLLLKSHDVGTRITAYTDLVLDWDRDPKEYL